MSKKSVKNSQYNSEDLIVAAIKLYQYDDELKVMKTFKCIEDVMPRFDPNMYTDMRITEVFFYPNLQQVDIYMEKLDGRQN